MFTFAVADLVTGRLRSELPLNVEEDLSRLMMDVGTGTLSLAIRDKRCPSNWEDLTLPWRNLYAVIDDVSGRIIWAGVPTNRTRDPVSGLILMPCVTLESYMARRYVGNLRFEQADQTSTIANRIARTCNDNNGIGFTLETPASGVFRDRVYYDDESGRVLDRLQELAQVINGFEWSIDVRWADDAQTRFEKVFRTGHPNIGRITDNPSTVFEMPGSITAAQYDEIWGETTAATHVVAVGDGEGEARIMSDPVIDIQREEAGWPRLELRRQFSSVRTTGTINNHAAAVYDEVAGGEQVITLTTRTDQSPTLGDWNLGDSVGVSISTDNLQLDQVWRIVGWHLSGDDYQVRPSIARVRS